MALLQLDNVTKEFEGLTAVERCCIEVTPGSVYGLIGPNGAGKTTLFNLISGLDRPTSGRVFFSDKDITGLPPYKRARQGIARTFQLISLFGGMSILDNVIMGRHAAARSGWLASILRFRGAIRKEREDAERAEELLDLVGLTSLEEAPGGLAKNLPYGSQRLLEIARALASDPKLLLLDEPGAGMNDSEMQHLKELIQKIRTLGVTVLFVEHDMQFTAAIADRVFVLDHGATIAEGTPAEIQANDVVREAYLGKTGAGHALS